MSLQAGEWELVYGSGGAGSDAIMRVFSTLSVIHLITQTVYLSSSNFGVDWPYILINLEGHQPNVACGNFLDTIKSSFFFE